MLVIFFHGPAQAQAIQTMIYDVYAGGLNAVQARLNVDTRHAGRYDMVMDARTRGFLGSVAPWNGTFETHGWQTDKGFKPELHKSTTVWDDEAEIKEYMYNKDGTFKGYAITEAGKTNSDAVEKALTENTTDALTATMLVMSQVAQGQACQGTSEVFDGDRRYKMTFKQEGTQQLEPTRYNVYKGPAEQCTVEVEPLIGKWHEKPRGWLSIQEQGRAQGTMPTVWFARLDPNGPAVPIKIRVKTDYGTLFAHLAQYTNDQGTVIAQKRGDE